MTGGPDHSGDAARQRLAEIYDGRGENDPLADYALYDAALTAVLDLHPRVVFTGFERALLSISEWPNVGVEVCK